ncbi:MAG: Nif3-like dinuclear metal center hexameric protein [Bacteroidales bacterium OttesenSCG-928-I14]|jgi:dinuclear metal center YbgI/SA1388 family protein|nr:Nif3-like dinuclear metal center hexameric protein [Bacteroidales bacterium OttesenSCG-928-I14]
MKIAEIIKYIETFAPLSLQDDFDNSGLQIGNIYSEINGVLLCLNITEKVIDEAIEKSCNLIISHHPLLFKSLKKITNQTYIERCIIKSCQNNITIFSAHTNLDNTIEGINFYLAKKIGLKNTHTLKIKKNYLLKLVTFVPIQQIETVKKALFNAGAGNIGNYNSCSFSSTGNGSFKSCKNSHTFIGECDKFHEVKEVRLEIVLPIYKKEKILHALLKSHPYEEPAYDFYPLLNSCNKIGSGITGELNYNENEELFLKKIKTIFNLKIIKHSPFTGKIVNKIAICSGNGSFLIKDAIACQADVFLTGEAKYNDYYYVEDKILLVVIGHYESECYAKHIFFDAISKKMPNITVYLSEMDKNPVIYYK